MTETVIFTSPSASISTARAVLAGTTYSIANITSVRLAHKKRPMPLFWLLGFLALGMSLARDWAVVAFLVIVAVVLWLGLPEEWGVIVASASGEQTGLKSRDRAYVEQVLKALNDAIASR